MIEINLLPGAGKKKQKGGGGGGPKLDLGAAVRGISGRVKDKFLVAAIASVVIAAAAFGLMFTTQSARAEKANDRLEAAVADSAHVAKVLRDREAAEVQRDSVLRQMNIIRAIDNDRFVWPHIMDEVSKALPPYTWLSILSYTGTPAGQVPAAPPPRRGGAARADTAKKKIETTVPVDTVHVRVMGQTVDIQALTRFMRDLESSPFLSNVELVKSELALNAGKEVTQFTVDVTYTRPDSTMLHRAPLSMSAR